MTDSFRLISVGQAAKLLGVVPATLRRWEARGLITSHRAGIKYHRRYYESEVWTLAAKQPIPHPDLAQLGRYWATQATAPEISPDYYCATSDRFITRLNRLATELKKILGENAGSLIRAITGEIGNNSFDNNIGNWPDTKGIMFGYDLTNHRVVLADRGQGVRATLRRSVPTISTDREALTIAFTERVSGRRPESRGNGLKFVRQVIANANIKLTFWSGAAQLVVGPHNDRLNLTKSPTLRGCLAIIDFHPITNNSTQ